MLNVSDLTVTYKINDKLLQPALDHVSLQIPGEGYTLGLVGESGSGKTTLGMGILNLLEPPAVRGSGKIVYNGTNIFEMSKEQLQKYRWHEVSMVYQSAMNSLNPVRRITDPLVEVIRVHEHATKAEARDLTQKLLLEVGIKREFINSYPHELSGGMRQRVVIALALALSPKLLIADEPTSALDVVVQREILQLLKREIEERKLSLLFITHELSLLEDLVENVAVMYRGEIVEIGTEDKVLNDTLHPYSQMLLRNLITMESSYEQLAALMSNNTMARVGGQPVPANACKFSNRCPFAFDRCRVEKPQLRETKGGGGHKVACHLYN